MTLSRGQAPHWLISTRSHPFCDSECSLKTSQGSETWACLSEPQRCQLQRVGLFNIVLVEKCLSWWCGHVKALEDRAGDPHQRTNSQCLYFLQAPQHWNTRRIVFARRAKSTVATRGSAQTCPFEVGRTLSSSLRARGPPA